VVAGMVTFAFCKASKTDGMALAVTLAMGVTVTPRFYLYDLAIALPAALVILRWFTDSPAAASLPHESPTPAGVVLQKSHTLDTKRVVESCI
jgi:hypothetical protein